MMSVPGIGTLPPVQPGGRTAPSVEGGRFGAMAERAAMRLPAAGAAIETGSVAGLLALDEPEEKAARDRRARRRGEQVLGALARIQRGLLGGAHQDEALDELRGLLADMPTASDARLASALREIACRARIVLALRAPRDSPE